MKCEFLLSSLACFLLNLLSGLSLGFGSWLETNSLVYTSQSQNLSFIKLNLYPLNSKQSPVTLTLGLWRYCFHSDSSYACSPNQMNFNAETYGIFKVNHPLELNIDSLPLLDTLSYIRFIPLLLATCFAFSSFVISIYLLFDRNKKKTIQRKGLFYIVSALNFTCALLISIPVGVTLNDYTTNVNQVCSLNDIRSQYRCTDYKLSTELIVLSLSIGLFIVSSVYHFLFQWIPSTPHPSNLTLPLSEEHHLSSRDSSVPHVPHENSISIQALYEAESFSLRPPPTHIKTKNRSNANQIDSLTQMTLNENTLKSPRLPYNNKKKHGRSSSYGSNNTFGFMKFSSALPTPASVEENTSHFSFSTHVLYPNGMNSVVNMSSNTLGGQLKYSPNHRSNLTNSSYFNISNSTEEELENNTNKTKSHTSSHVSLQSNSNKQLDNDLYSHRISRYFRS